MPSASGSTAKAGAILGHADAGSQSTRHAPANLGQPSNSRARTQTGGPAGDSRSPSARPCSSRDDVRLQALRARLGAPLARGPPRARGARRASSVRRRGATAEDDGRTDGGVADDDRGGALPGCPAGRAARALRLALAQPARHDLAREAHLSAIPRSRARRAPWPAVSSPLSSCALDRVREASSRSVFVIAGRLFPHPLGQFVLRDSPRSSIRCGTPPLPPAGSGSRAARSRSARARGGPRPGPRARSTGTRSSPGARAARQRRSPAISS